MGHTPTGRDVVVILSTAQVGQDHLELCLARGGSKVLSKLPAAEVR